MVCGAARASLFGVQWGTRLPITQGWGGGLRWKGNVIPWDMTGRVITLWGQIGKILVPWGPGFLCYPLSCLRLSCPPDSYAIPCPACVCLLCLAPPGKLSPDRAAESTSGTCNFATHPSPSPVMSPRTIPNANHNLPPTTGKAIPAPSTQHCRGSAVPAQFPLRRRRSPWEQSSAAHPPMGRGSPMERNNPQGPFERMQQRKTIIRLAFTPPGEMYSDKSASTEGRSQCHGQVQDQRGKG